MDERLFMNQTKQDASLARAMLRASPLKEQQLVTLFAALFFFVLLSVLSVLGNHESARLCLRFCVLILLLSLARIAAFLWVTRKAIQTEAVFYDDHLDFSSTKNPTPRSFAYDNIKNLVISKKIILLEFTNKRIVLDRQGFIEGSAESFISHFTPLLAERARKTTRKRAVRRTILLILFLLVGTKIVLAPNQADQEDTDGKAIASDITIAGRTCNLSAALELADHAGNGELSLCNNSVAIFQLDESLYLNITNWVYPGVHTEGNFYLPVLVDLSQPQEKVEILGANVCSIGKTKNAANQQISAVFVQKIGPYTIINIGSRSFPEMKTDQLVPRDNYNNAPFLLSEDCIDEANSSNDGWLYLPVVESGRIFIAERGLSKKCSYIFVLKELPDDYTITCGDWTLTGQEIQDALDHPFRGSEDTIYLG